VVLKPGERPSAFLDSGMDQMYIRVLKGETTARRLGRLQLRAQIASPADGAILRAGRQIVWGFAWGSESLLTGVQVSLDNGESWQKARLETAPDRFLWTRWSFDWDARPGGYTLLSRAEDESGGLQPLIRDPRRVDGYELNQCARLHCSVR
jgi:Mo-co oxidoreductase dimerisation domain